MSTTKGAMPVTQTNHAAAPAKDAVDQVLDQMFSYYTRECPTPRVITELDSREAA